jgi:hypothetical protein
MIAHRWRVVRKCSIWGDLVHDGSLVHTHKGETAPERAWLEAALAIFRRLGARTDAERTA